MRILIAKYQRARTRINTIYAYYTAYKSHTNVCISVGTLKGFGET